jgi:hypothetical protein
VGDAKGDRALRPPVVGCCPARRYPKQTLSLALHSWQKCFIQSTRPTTFCLASEQKYSAGDAQMWAVESKIIKTESQFDTERRPVLKTEGGQAAAGTKGAMNRSSLHFEAYRPSLFLRLVRIAFLNCDSWLPSLGPGHCASAVWTPSEASEKRGRALPCFPHELQAGCRLQRREDGA